MKKTALVTGASSGIGWEFAHVFAREGYDLVLTARREKRLGELKSIIENEFSVNVTIVVCDLTQAGAAKEIYERVQSQNISIDALVNNAGFGKFGPFAQSDLDLMHEMVQVNIVALMDLTRLFLPAMVERKSGYILNVASMAGLVPGPFMSVYFASKSFVLSFSEALASELKGTGIFVTAQCPGPVKSEFQSVAYAADPTLKMKQRIPTSKETAEFGFKAMMQNRPVAVTGLDNIFLTWLIRFLPRKAVTALVRLRQESNQ